MDEALEIARPAARVDGGAVEVVLHDVGRRHQLGSDRARHQVAVGGFLVTHAHMAVPVDHALVGQDAVGGDQVLDQLRVNRARRGGRRLGEHVSHSRERAQRAGDAEQDMTSGEELHASLPVGNRCATPRL